MKALLTHCGCVRESGICESIVECDQMPLFMRLYEKRAIYEGDSDDADKMERVA